MPWLAWAVATLSVANHLIVVLYAEPDQPRWNAYLADLGEELRLMSGDEHLGMAYDSLPFVPDSRLSVFFDTIPLIAADVDLVAAHLEARVLQEARPREKWLGITRYDGQKGGHGGMRWEYDATGVVFRTGVVAKGDRPRTGARLRPAPYCGEGLADATSDGDRVFMTGRSRTQHEPPTRRTHDEGLHHPGGARARRRRPMSAAHRVFVGAFVGFSAGYVVHMSAGGLADDRITGLVFGGCVGLFGGAFTRWVAKSSMWMDGSDDDEHPRPTARGGSGTTPPKEENTT